MPDRNHELRFVRCTNCDREQALPGSWRLVPEENAVFLERTGWRCVTVQNPGDDLPVGEWYCPFWPGELCKHREKSRPGPVFRNWLKKKLWKIRALASATSPGFPKFQQPSTDFLRFGFVVLSCSVKVKSNSESPAAAGKAKAKPDEILTFFCWKVFQHPRPKNSAIRARARSLFSSLISSFSGHAASAGSLHLVRDRTETARARRAWGTGLSVRAWTERGMKGRDGIPGAPNRVIPHF
jgi:hypothetical protein